MDTLEIHNSLIGAGFSEKKSKALITIIRKAVNDKIDQNDLERLELRLKINMWLVGSSILAGIVALQQLGIIH